MQDDKIVKRCDFRMHDIIDGKYRVERVLESSLTDQKFKVVDSLGKEYVLKLLKLWDVEPRMQDKMLSSSENEIKSSLIKSNYLTTIVKTGTVNGNPYLLTGFYNSAKLTHFINDPKLNLVKTAKEILYGLRDLHKSGKVHCRLSTENILLNESGDVKITNYTILGNRGKVIMNKVNTPRNRFVDKSLAYLAPELYHLDRCYTILPSVDIFSFGVILFQLLTGTLPYGRLVTESDLIHYQSRVSSNNWNKNILLRNEHRDMWMAVLELCLNMDAFGRAKQIDDILDKLPAENYPYMGVEGSQVEAPNTILNGLKLHVMQGDGFGNYYHLSEIMQLPKRIITIGRSDNSIFNMIQLPENSSSYISRRHCTIELDDETDDWYIRDGQWNKEGKDNWSRSLNGTYVNSDEVTEEGHIIEPGDIITIGDTKLRVEAY